MISSLLFPAGVFPAESALLLLSFAALAGIRVSVVCGERRRIVVNACPMMLKNICRGDGGPPTRQLTWLSVVVATSPHGKKTHFSEISRVPGDSPRNPERLVVGGFSCVDHHAAVDTQHRWYRGHRKFSR